MESTLLIFIVGISILMLLGAFSSSRKKPDSHSDRSNASDFSLFDPDVTHHHTHHHSHHHGLFDHNTSSDLSHSHSHVDSGSCHSGDFGGGCDGGHGG